jgi:hypothetical protein
MKRFLIGTIFALAITPVIAADQGSDFYALSQMPVQNQAALSPMTSEELDAVEGGLDISGLVNTVTGLVQSALGVLTGAFGVAFGVATEHLGQ